MQYEQEYLELVKAERFYQKLSAERSIPMFSYQFPVSPYQVDLKEARGEYDATPELERQYPPRVSLRVRLAVRLHALADKLAPSLEPASPPSAPFADANNA